MVMCRKIMRFGRSTVTYRELVDAKSPEDAVQACALLAKACLFGFLVVDHVIWVSALARSLALALF
jgi:HD superfamily phosphodiesterase